MRTNVKITLIEQHEMVCNLLIPKTLIVAPRQSGKTTAIVEAIKQVEYFKVFVPRPVCLDRFVGFKGIHLSKQFNTLDIDSIAWKIFVDDIDLAGFDSNTKVPYVTMETSRIYSATSSTLDFDKIQLLIQVGRFNFERICVVDHL